MSTDETVLNIDGFVFVDPAIEMRQRSNTFLASRQWLTPSVFSGDQPEPEDVVEQQPAWSMAFVLGLDHIRTTHGDWFLDVEVLLDFVQTLQKELDNEFTVEVRFRSKPWHSEHIAFVDERPLGFVVIRAMIERAI